MTVCPPTPAAHPRRSFSRSTRSKLPIIIGLLSFPCFCSTETYGQIGSEEHGLTDRPTGNRIRFGDPSSPVLRTLSTRIISNQRIGNNRIWTANSDAFMEHLDARRCARREMDVQSLTDRKYLSRLTARKYRDIDNGRKEIRRSDLARCLTS